MIEGREGLIWDIVAGRRARPPCASLLDLTFLDVEPGRARTRFLAKEEFYNPAGVVQGGFLAAMLDDTLGPAAASTVEPGEFVTTVEVKVNFLRPARAGKLTGESQVVHRGRSIIFVEGSLSDADGSVVATASGTLRVVQTPAAPKDAERTIERRGA